MASVAKIFDASLQKEVDHVLEVDANGEIVATSRETGRSVKFPGDLTKAQFKKAVADHKKANEGQEVIPEEEIKAREEARAKAQDLVDSFGDELDDSEDQE